MRTASLLILFHAGSLVWGQISGGPSATSTPAGWTQRSDQYTNSLVDIDRRFFADSETSKEYDAEVTDLKAGFRQRRKNALKLALSSFEVGLKSEVDLRVQQDLEILINRTQQDIRGLDLQDMYLVPYFDIAEMTFNGIHELLTDQMPQERRLKALVRLQKYAGTSAGFTPFTILAEQAIRDGLRDPKLLGPVKNRVERTVANNSTYLRGIAQLFERYRIEGYQESLRKLARQISHYNQFLRSELLPRARKDFSEPSELYAFRMGLMGLDIPPEKLAESAHSLFKETQSEMILLSPKVAREKHLSIIEYRDLIRALKADQWEGPLIVRNYEQRFAEIEKIIQREHLVTLPSRVLRVRLATEAESASSPSPSTAAPKTTDDVAVFTLPVRIPASVGSTVNQAQRFDDFTFAAASWPLAAHEGIPGHALQFDLREQSGVSLARSRYADTEAATEGWGLYAEAILRPYMPLDGQFISLQFFLWRCARAFLDPEIRNGTISPEQGKRILVEDVGLSEALANQEIERYTLRLPGQAMCYLYGYLELMRLRAETEREMGPRFQQQAFHDFILSQGSLPLPLLRKNVHEQLCRRLE